MHINELVETCKKKETCTKLRSGNLEGIFHYADRDLDS